MTLNTLEDLFDHQLRAAYTVENRLVDTLSEMASQVDDEELADGFGQHEGETMRHVERVEEVFEARGLTPEETEVPLFDGLMEEKRMFDEQLGEEGLRDVFYAQAGMKTERIELTMYEGLLLLADQLDLGDEVTDPLEENRDEEEKTLKKLKGMATGSTLLGDGLL